MAARRVEESGCPTAGSEPPVHEEALQGEAGSVDQSEDELIASGLDSQRPGDPKDARPGKLLPVKRKNINPTQNSRVLVDSVHLSVLATAYNREFPIYSKGQKQVTQLVLKSVWKEVYSAYKLKFPDSEFAEETLKEKLRVTLKEINTGTANEAETGRATLQNEETLNMIRMMDGHARRNVLKRDSLSLMEMKLVHHRLQVRLVHQVGLLLL